MDVGKVMCTLLYSKWITNKDLVQQAHGTLLNVMCHPGWARVWGRMDTCVCMAESLHCLPDATTLLVCYILIQNKKV